MIIDQKRERYRAKNGFASAPIRKERLSPTSKERREASQNKFVKNGRMLYRVEGFREDDSSKNRTKAKLGFVKPIRNGLRKKKNLI